MPELKGFAPPYTATGRSALIPDPPWFYSGDLLTVEYRTDVERVRALLPDDVDLAEDDPGAVAFIWADWQSCSSGGAELLDPARSQYKEAFAVVRCRYQGTTYSRCVLIWVTTDFAIARGLHQGYPKKLGSIHQTRPMPYGQGAPRIQAGARFGATLAAYDHRLAQAVVTLTEPSPDERLRELAADAAPPSVRPIERGAEGWALDEVLTMSGVGFEAGQAWKAEATLDLFDSPWDDVATTLPVREVLSGYYVQVGTSWDGGTTLAHR